MDTKVLKTTNMQTETQQTQSSTSLPNWAWEGQGSAYLEEVCLQDLTPLTLDCGAGCPWIISLVIMLNTTNWDTTLATIILVKRFRFALAAVGDEQEPCPKQEAAWEFRSG